MDAGLDSPCALAFCKCLGETTIAWANVKGDMVLQNLFHGPGIDIVEA